MNKITKIGIGAGLITSSLCFGANTAINNDSASAAKVNSLQCPSIKIGFVDPVKVYDNYKRAKVAQEKFELLVKQAQTEIDKRMEKVKGLFKERDEGVKKYQNPSTSEDAKKKLAEELQGLEEKIQKEGEAINLFRQESDRNLDEQRHKILSEHYKEIEYVVQKISREKGFHLTLNAQSTFYTSHCIIDITEDVIEELNKIAEASEKKAGDKSSKATK